MHQLIAPSTTMKICLLIVGYIYLLTICVSVYTSIPQHHAEIQMVSCPFHSILDCSSIYQQPVVKRVPERN